MSEANKYQVGGRHYKTSYEHWDMCLDVCSNYLESCASKYVSRWQKKAGIEDLQKAVHYVNKLIEAVLTGRVLRFSVVIAPDYQRACVKRFVEANQLSTTEAEVVETLVMWTTVAELYTARDGILAMMQAWDACNPAQPVPATDSNKHAERKGEE